MGESLPVDVVHELTVLRDRIHLIMHEVAAVRHPQASEDRLKGAAEELDAIVSVTEGATNGILATAEQISSVADELSGMTQDSAVQQRAEAIQDLVGELFTQCAFQDITGQRVGKVVGVLNFVEERIARIIDGFGDGFHQIPVPVSTSAGARGAEAHLLNGPQDASRAVSQADIDALFG